MTKTLLYIPVRLSNLTVDHIHYELVDDDLRKRAERLQARRWRMMQQVAARRIPRHTYERSLL